MLRHTGGVMAMVVAVALLLAACRDLERGDRRHPWITTLPPPTTDPTGAPGPGTGDPNTFVPPIDTAAGEGGLRFAIIGDYGIGSGAEGEVADIVAAWAPDFVLTVGDNNYPSGAESTLDDNVGPYYGRFIHPYKGKYGAGASINRFFPSPGNHDWGLGNLDPYLDYFNVPGIGRYYKVTWGPIAIFSVDSDFHEPHGIDRGSIQAAWLRSSLADTKEPWTIAIMHHPPWSSGSHGPTEPLQWPWAAWGVDIVWGGHDHSYERLVKNDVLFGIDGRGGASLYGMRTPLDGSQLAFDDEHGATLFELADGRLTLSAVTTGGVLVERFSLLEGQQLGLGTPLVVPHSEWRYLDSGVAPANAWNEAVFNDNTWSRAPGILGFGDPDVDSVVSYGPDAKDKHITTWFRRVFQLPDLELAGDIAVELLAHDGAVAYVNGTEVLRTNMPAGPIGPGTLALADGYPMDPVRVEVPGDMLVQGNNVVAVEVHLASPTAQQLRLDAAIDGLNARRLVALDALWSYDDDDGAPVAGWDAPGFDDAGWKRGPAPLGWGLLGAGTVIDSGVAGQRHRTSWYRHRFEVTGAAGIERLLLRVQGADGVRLVLNGAEVHRRLLDWVGDVADDAFAGGTVPAGWETLPAEDWLDPGLLVEGENVLAAEVHLATADAERSWFGVELVPFD